MTRPFKERLTANDAMFGVFAFLPSPDVVELLGLCKFDYVMIDLEHSPKNWEAVANMVRAAQLSDMAPLIRVKENSQKQILEALEVGAEGIVIPFVQSAAEVSEAARSIRFPPDGVRGACSGSRAARFGTLRPNIAAFAQRKNKEIALIALIEDMNGVNAIDAILDCDPGADVIMVGRGDLSASMGYMGQVNHPEVMRAVDKIMNAVRKQSRSVQVGMVITPNETKHWLDFGCRFLGYGTDSDLLLGAALDAQKSFAAALG